MSCACSTTASSATSSPKLLWADMNDDDIHDWEVDGKSDEEAHSQDMSSASGAEEPQASCMQATDIKGGQTNQQKGPTVSCRKTSQNKSSRRPRPRNSAALSGSHVRNTPPQDTCTAMGAFCVEVYGMPVALCNNDCLDAMLNQAGLKNFIVVCEANKEGGGRAVIKLSTWNQAVKCQTHFAKSTWSRGAMTVRIVRQGTQYPMGNVWWPSVWGCGYFPGLLPY